MIKGSITAVCLGGTWHYVCSMRTPRIQVSKIGTSRVDAINRAWHAIILPLESL